MQGAAVLDFDLGLLKFLRVSELEFQLQGGVPDDISTVNSEISTSEIKWNV